MALAAFVCAWKVLRKRRSDKRSRGLYEEKLYEISLEILPVSKEDVL